MKDIETIRILLRRQYMKCTAGLRKKILKCTDFTIISNNCWGGFIYQSYKLPYQTPTIGLYFMAKDYILFLENFEYCLNSKIISVNPEFSKYNEKLKFTHKYGEYPIGKIVLPNLEIIEIHFLHYTTFEEAIDKWNSRKKRINKKNMIIKFSDQNDCNFDLIKRFENLPFENKIFFGSKKYTDNTIYIKVPTKYSYVPTSYEPFGFSKVKNITKLLNYITRM